MIKVYITDDVISVTFTVNGKWIAEANEWGNDGWWLSSANSVIRGEYPRQSPEPNKHDAVENLKECIEGTFRKLGLYVEFVKIA